MIDDSTLVLLADAVLVLHALVVAFIVGGLLCVVVGNALGWAWVNRRVFRVVHVAAMLIVVAEAWAGIVCPLTWLEVALRVEGGATAHAQDFIAHWLQRLLFFEAPWWVFALAYTAFFLLVLLAWRRYPPAPSRGAPRARRSAQ